ncbi:MAG TPA: GNAT family N-acetyltransferase [Anaerolineales bacterium]|nr:GNAT family N-acetyltransferase [Anaerolineales bacterium]
MDLRSLGYRTDLIFPEYEGQILDRGEYLVIRTPSNPSFYWGNFVLFRNPPAEGDHHRWRQVFADEIGRPPDVSHETFGWDSPEGTHGLVAPFLEAGFTLLTSRVLTARKVFPPARPNRDIRVRALESDQDWRTAVDLQVYCRMEGQDDLGYRLFRERQMGRYRAMAHDGLGHWFGAFLGGELIADLGLFHRDSLARFQSVETHPDHRRRGIAGTLVYEASKSMLREGPDLTLVIVADEGSSAEKLYRGVGFAPAERQVGLEKWERVSLEKKPEA